MKKLVDLDENAEVIAVFNNKVTVRCKVKSLHRESRARLIPDENRVYIQEPGVFELVPTGIRWEPEFLMEKLLDYCDYSLEMSYKDATIPSNFLTEVSDLLYKKTLESGNFFAKQDLEPNRLDISGFKFKD